MKKRNILIPVFMGITFCLITITGIRFEQSLLRMVPLYVSLVIALLQSRVNRYAPLIGSINSILYAAVYFHYHLYASAIYAIAVSCPVQLATFILWCRHPWKSSTLLKRLTSRQRIVLAAATVIVWCVACFALSGTSAKYREIDTAVTVLGIAATILTLLSYCEYTVLMIAGGSLSIILYLCMLKDTPEQITYLEFSVYSLICQIFACRQVSVLYQEQRKEESLC